MEVHKSAAARVFGVNPCRRRNEIFRRGAALSFLPPLRPSSFFLISSLASLYSRLSDSSLFSLSLFLFRSVGRAKRSCLRKEERPSSLPCAGNGTGVETGLEVVRSRDSRFSFPSKEKEARDLFSR